MIAITFLCVLFWAASVAERIRMLTLRYFLGALLTFLCLNANAEEVDVKYHGKVNLAYFRCERFSSNVVKRVCFDKSEKYLIVKLVDTYYHHCGIDEDLINEWRGADSKGRFYHQNIRGNFDCRTGHIPKYR